MSEQTGWQPIATVPRDGTHVLAVVEDPQCGQFHATVYWNVEMEWLETVLGGYTLGWEVTHWAPLPPLPPVIEEKTK